MKFYRKQIETAVEYFKYNPMKYENSIIIGDNAVGKSEVTKEVIKSYIKTEQKVYFIDAINRKFDVKHVNGSISHVIFSDKITKNRLKDENFNLQDTWAYYGTEQERIEIIYPYYEEKVQKLFKEFTGVSFTISMKETSEVFYDSEEEGKISSGYQAILRILLELVYVSQTLNDDGKKILVFIDELDEYLSPKNSARIFPFLIRKFPEFQFVITTHSADLIASTENANILILKSGMVEIVDSNDFFNIDDVIHMFKTVFGREEDKKNDCEEQLRMLLNNKISGIWNDENEILLRQLETNKLSNVQEFLLKQIKEW